MITTNQPPGADALNWCHEHPANRYPRAFLARLLRMFCTTPASVVRVAHESGGALVGLMLDGLAATAPLVLEVVGIESSDHDEDLAAHLGRHAFAYAKAHNRDLVDIPLQNSIRGLGAGFQTAGFHAAFTSYEMRRVASTRPDPAGDWRAADSDTVRAYRNIVKAAMSGLDGSYAISGDDFENTVLNSPIPHELLYVDGELAGFSRVSVEGTTGHIDMIGRVPAFARRGLGDRLLARALWRLETLGARDVTLEVAVSNPRALALYERAGFSIESETVTWQRSTKP